MDSALRPCDRDLLALLAGVPPAPVSRRAPEESHELVRQLMRNWQILPSITDKQMDEALIELLTIDDYRQLRHTWLAVCAFSKAQIVAYWKLIRAFEQAKLPYSLLKGSATAFLLYPEPFMRGAWDLDIGVPHDALARAQAVTHEIGYRPAQQDPVTHRFYLADATARAAVEADHYELGFLVRRLQVTNLDAATLAALRAEPWTKQYWFDVESDAPWCYASVDVHHAVSLDIELDELLTHTRRISVGGTLLSVPDDAWIGAHLVFKLYWEGVHNYGKGLYGYADLVRLAPRLDADTFVQLVDILDRYKLQAAGHYVFRRLSLFGITLSEPIQRFVDETAIPDRQSDPIHLNDLGDMWPKIWGRR